MRGTFGHSLFGCWGADSHRRGLIFFVVSSGRRRRWSAWALSSLLSLGDSRGLIFFVVSSERPHWLVLVRSLLLLLLSLLLLLLLLGDNSFGSASLGSAVMDLMALMALMALVSVSVSVSVSVAKSLTAALICWNHEDRS